MLLKSWVWANFKRWLCAALQSCLVQGRGLFVEQYACSFTLLLGELAQGKRFRQRGDDNVAL